MSWSGIANNQTVSQDNIKDAVNTNTFTPIATIPAGAKELTKTEAASYVCLDTAYAPFAAKASNQIVIKTDCIPCATGCTCPAGYVSNPDGTICVKTTTTSATPSGGGTVLACHFNYTNYGQYGVVFYQPAGYGLNGAFTTTPNYFKTANIGGSYTGTMWANPSSNITDGRLNSTGIWKCGDQNYSATPLGFSRQINIPVSKQYYIAIGADNYATIRINGVDIVVQNESAMATALGTGVDCTFKYWHVYPVDLIAGPNLLEITATNAGSLGIFGCEIYDATEVQLMATVILADLMPYIVFTTANYPSLGTGNYVADNDPFEVGSYTCPSGYTLLYEDGSYICRKIETTACL